MKIKSDFVTNSSTTCFVMVGYHVLETKEIKEFYDNYNNNFDGYKFYIGGDEDGAEPGYVLFGMSLMSLSENDPELDEVPISKINQCVEEVYKEFGEKLNLKKEDIKLIGSVRMS